MPNSSKSRFRRPAGGRKVTLEQIARAAGVSIATASRALNGSTNVSEELERKVRHAVARLGGTRSAARTGVLGVLLGNRPILHGFHSRVLSGIESFVLGRGSAAVFFPIHYDELQPWRAIPLPRILQNRREPVDGFILAGTHSPNIFDMLMRLERPFVVYGNNVLGAWNSEAVDCVFSDDFGGAYEVTQLLIHTGHRNIWFLADRELPWRRTRYEGYRRAIEDVGLEPHSLPTTPANEAETGYLATKSLLSDGAPLDAILAGGDPAAQGVYEAAKERALQVGKDLSVAGFDDFHEGVALQPPLTTVRTFPEEIGQRLSELVWRRLEDPSLPPRKLVVPTRLIQRESVRGDRITESRTRTSSA